MTCPASVLAGVDGVRPYAVAAIVAAVVVASLVTTGLDREAGTPADPGVPAAGPETPIEDWNPCLTHADGHVASVLVDLAWRARTPDRSRPVLAWVRLSLRAPRSDGLSSPEESDALLRVERDVRTAVALATRGLARLVGSITTPGVRELDFYGPSAGAVVADAIQAARDAGYEATVGTREDPAWSRYVGHPHPSVGVLQTIHQRPFLRILRERRDVASIA